MPVWAIVVSGLLLSLAALVVSHDGFRGFWVRQGREVSLLLRDAPKRLHAIRGLLMVAVGWRLVIALIGSYSSVQEYQFQQEHLTMDGSALPDLRVSFDWLFWILPHALGGGVESLFSLLNQITRVGWFLLYFLSPYLLFRSFREGRGWGRGWGTHRPVKSGRVGQVCLIIGFLACFVMAAYMIVVLFAGMSAQWMGREVNFDHQMVMGVIFSSSYANIIVTYLLGPVLYAFGVFWFLSALRGGGVSSTRWKATMTRAYFPLLPCVFLLSVYGLATSFYSLWPVRVSDREQVVVEHEVIDRVFEWAYPVHVFLTLLLFPVILSIVQHRIGVRDGFRAVGRRLKCSWAVFSMLVLVFVLGDVLVTFVNEVLGAWLRYRSLASWLLVPVIRSLIRILLSAIFLIALVRLLFPGMLPSENGSSEGDAK